MVAVVTSSGAFIYDLSVKQADEKFKDESCYYLSKDMIGLFFHSEELPSRLRQMGICACYVDINSLDDKRKQKMFLKISIEKLSEVWSKVFFTEKAIIRN